MSDNLPSTFIWHDDHTGAMMSAVIDYDDARVQWYEEVGCACGDSFAVQSIADYLARGPRGVMVPDETAQAIRSALQSYEDRISAG